MIRIGVVGATGKMGSEVCRAVHADADLSLAAAVSRSAAGEGLDEAIGLADTGVVAQNELAALERAAVDVAVDFTGPAFAREHVEHCIAHGIHAVVGTTGFEVDPAWADQRDVGVLVASNFAIGAALMMRFAAQAARFLPDVEIIEYHGPAKLDAPSGTALSTSAVIEAARETAATVPIHSVRLPGVVADQDVLFGGPGQTLRIRHATVDRTAFMPGVLMAVKAVPSRPGLTIGLDPLLEAAP